MKSFETIVIYAIIVLNRKCNRQRFGTIIYKVYLPSCIFLTRKKIILWLLLTKQFKLLIDTYMKKKDPAEKTQVSPDIIS